MFVAALSADTRSLHVLVELCIFSLWEVEGLVVTFGIELQLLFFYIYWKFFGSGPPVLCTLGGCRSSHRFIFCVYLRITFYFST